MINSKPIQSFLSANCIKQNTVEESDVVVVHHKGFILKGNIYELMDGMMLWILCFLRRLDL